MDNTSFASVTARLVQLLECGTETKLAALLGFSQSAWGNRKMRGSLPREQIGAVIAEHGLNPEYIYNGTGDVYAPFEGEPWESLYAKRAVVLGLETAWLRSRGHTDDTIAALMKPKGKVLQVLAALRDFRETTHADLNWLIAAQAEPARPVAASPLLEAYDRCRDADQAAVLHIVKSLARQPTAEATHRAKVSIAGNVGQQVQGSVVNHAPVTITQSGGTRAKTRPPK